MNFIKEEYGNNNEFRASQDISGYLDYANESRKQAKSLFANQKTNYRSFAIIPDIIAVDIMTRFKLDVNDSSLGPEGLAKLRNIIINNYPQLLTGNIIKNPKGR